MKKLLLIALCLPGLAFAQIAGVGIFRINKSDISLMDTLSQEIHGKLRTSFEDIGMTIFKGINSHKTDKIVELISDVGLCCGTPNQDMNVRLFYINYYNVSGIGIEDILLTFYRDTLIQFKCKASKELLEALNIKYGKPVTKELIKTIACQNGFGAKTYEDEYSTYYSWNTKAKNVSAKAEELFFYSNDCTLLTVEHFILKDFIKKNRIDKVQERLQAEAEKIEQNDKAKKLINF